MADALLSLVLAEDFAEPVADLLLSRPDLVPGFSSGRVDGHGSAVRLVAAGELVRGHAPRVQIQAVGDEAALRRLLALVKRELPQASVFYWLTPITEAGYL